MPLLECAAAEAIWIGDGVRATVIGHADDRIWFMVIAPRGLALTGADGLVFSHPFGKHGTEHTFWMRRGGRFGIGPAEVRAELRTDPDPQSDFAGAGVRRFVLQVDVPSGVAVERDGPWRVMPRPLPLAG